MTSMLELVTLIQGERIREADRQRLGRLATCRSRRTGALSRLVRSVRAIRPATTTQ